MRQRTIRNKVSCSGVGLHTGQFSTIEFAPTEENSGICFIKSGKRISACIENVTATLRGTSIGDISTVEHVLSAIYGIRIDNINIFIDGNEMPALDGSSVEYVKLLESAEIESQNYESHFIDISKPISVREADSEIAIFPSDRLIIEAHVDFPKSFVGKQSALFDESQGDFANDIAPARTFGFLSEVDDLRKRGLAKGASFENAIVISDGSYSSALRFANELARHKILDIMGDMAVSGRRIRGKILSNKASHRLNIALVRRILNDTGQL